ncbi:homoserine dehydrogenase [Amnibacterium kyonggiense]|uniref:Homoserine dehydrogenase n=1 Tax=Amnibacterium kyonggiense TaxID=595671 RepID=A0A4R7FJ08_9MICO|nr:homoserine dehydrogenase [Amnibacterium kyonggiense]TDS75782.1 homoserine dehydrogenase [Amnibacterium kyonggiense]
MTPGALPIRVAVLGAGTVGAEVAHQLLSRAAELESRVGAPLVLAGVAVRDLTAVRQPSLPKELLTTDAESLVLGAHIVVELIGGTDRARELVLLALESGADVVTGNKALLATHGSELFAAAERVGAQLNYEAAVGGAIPIIRPLRDSLAGDDVRRILGVVNGTTNFVLDRMDEHDDTFDEALAEATRRGYAEADPSGDVSGTDAAQKAAILAGLAFHTRVPLASVPVEGIERVSIEQIRAARETGHVVKLLAICERLTGPDGVEAVSARVHPALLPRRHPLASVRGANNAVFVEAESAGDLMFYGAGAGGPETASAVLGDLVSAARRHVIGGPGLAAPPSSGLPVIDPGLVTSRYQVSLTVRDEPGVLAHLATIVAEHGVSIETAQQTKAATGGTATLVIGTHRAPESALSAVVTALGDAPEVDAVAGVLRIEGE